MNTGFWKSPLLDHPGRKHRVKGYFLRIKKKRKEKKLQIFHASGGGRGKAWVPLKALGDKKTCFYIFVFFFLSLSLNNYGPFCFPRYFIMFIQVHIPCKYFSLFYLRIIRRIRSHWTLQRGWTLPCRRAPSRSIRWWWDWRLYTATQPSYAECIQIESACRSVLWLGAGAQMG